MLSTFLTFLVSIILFCLSAIMLFSIFSAILTPYTSFRPSGSLTTSNSLSFLLNW